MVGMMSSSNRNSLRGSSIRELCILLLALILPTAGCKEEAPHILPHAEVQFTLVLSLPEYVDLQIPGGIYLVKNEGYGEAGVYVARSLTPEADFQAYDAVCPAHQGEVVITEWKRGTTTVKCPNCGREYHLLNQGYTADGNERLQPYRTHLEGDILTVRND